MTRKEINDKVGAMHFRFLDDEESYDTLLELLNDYAGRYDQYGKAVTAALEDGLQNMERYIKLENALSPRSIIIEKQEYSQGRDSRDTEGAFHVVFVMDDESRHVIHFNRKQDQLLYMLMLLCSQKSGLLSDFFKYETRTLTPVQEAVIQLVKLVYPHMKEKPVIQMVKDLSPDNSFTSILQNMKEPITEYLEGQQLSDDQYWFMPYTVNLKKKRLYKMHLPQPNIIIPEEFIPIIDALPDVYDMLNDEERKEKDKIELPVNMANAFAWAKQAAEEGDNEGLYQMGVFYGTGDMVSQDYKTSIEYFKQADLKGFLEATFQLGVYHQFGFGVRKNIQKALSYFERAAANGHAEAAAWAAQIYERGSYGVKENHQKAFNLYMIAAEQDYEEAIWYVIQGYLYGQGIEEDFDKAYEWFLKAEALGYEKIRTLFGVHYYNQGDEESLGKALGFFVDGANADIPQAFQFLGRMALKGYCRTNDSIEEAKEYFLEGARLGDNVSIEILKKYFPECYAEHFDEFEEHISMHDCLIEMVTKMGNNIIQQQFLELIDGYRERWHESYLAEVCKQLNIHKKTDDGDDNSTSSRRIIIRKNKYGKVPYEIVLTLYNGEEVVIKKINLNCLTLFLLTIICSYKSGYTTMMATNSLCRPVLKALALLVNGTQVGNLDYYVDSMMSYEKNVDKKKSLDYYKQYSKMMKDAIKKAIGYRDEVDFFLFENIKTTGRKNLRRMNLDTQHIEIPQELMDLAYQMPDAMNIINSPDTQTLIE